MSVADGRIISIHETSIRKAFPVEDMTSACLGLHRQGLSVKEIASKLMVSKDTVNEYLAISRLPPEIQELIPDKLTRKQGKMISLAGYPSKENMRRYAEAVLSGELLPEEVDMLPGAVVADPEAPAEGIINKFIEGKVGPVTLKIPISRIVYLALNEAAERFGLPGGPEEAVRTAIDTWLTLKGIEVKLG